MSDTLDIRKPFTIGELAERTGVATSALRFYEERGLIHLDRMLWILRTKGSPLISAIDIHTARFLADLCEKAYLSAQALQEMLMQASSDSLEQLDFEADKDFFSDHSAGIYCFLASSRNGDTLYLCFRGTDGYGSLTTDLRGIRTARWSVNGQRLMVGHGFLTAYQKVNRRIIARIIERQAIVPKTLLYIAGHSLGGALAMIAAVDLGSQLGALLFQQVAICTFAAPYAGNYNFSAFYNHFVQRNIFSSVHFVSGRDPIMAANTLLSIIGRTPVNNVIKLSSPLRDAHSMRTYIDILNNLDILPSWF
jgi:DNA-binding transcriptional MerR regulator